MKIHSVLYTVFFDENFDEYLNYINSSVKNFYILNFKLV